MHGLIDFAPRSPLPPWVKALIVAVASALCLPIGHALAADDGAMPILRIESGAHSAAIRSIATDAAGRFVVTASEDKTARVWDVASARPLQVLRPPIGAGNDGKLFAVAMSANGELVAVGGWSKDNDVYVFQRASGQLIHRVTGLPNVIAHLAFSPDANLLVVSMWGSNGIRVYASKDGWHTSRESAVDHDYGGASYGADFSSDGKRLVTTCFDGLIRLYNVADGNLSLVKNVQPRREARPFTAVFSPDRQSIAVGFADSNAVVVLHAENLTLSYKPNVSGIDNGDLSAVAWSADGNQLYAAGSWRHGDAQHGLRRWADAGRGSYTDRIIAGNTVVGLRPAADGRMFFAATDPLWGIVSTAPDALSSNSSGLADFRGNREAFRLAPDGSAVSFGFVSGRSNIGAFDVNNMETTAPDSHWSGPSSGTKAMVITDWMQNPRPILNRRPLKLDQDEIALSASIDSGESHLALGTSFNLRYFNRAGIEQWNVATPGAAWQVNLSQDGRWVVAGFSDGTIRWYRTRDGALQLAFFPHADRKRWVMWTPQGYFAASPGGEDLIGWHVNRGDDRAADFFPASRFRSTYFRPDVIAQVLAQADDENALTAANAAAGRNAEQSTIGTIAEQLPPVVSVLSPNDGESATAADIKVRVTVHTAADAPVTSLRARVNGLAVNLPESRSLAAPPGNDRLEREYVLPLALPAQDAEIMVFAENRHGFSTPAVVRVRRAAPPPTQSAAAKAPQSTASTGGPDLRPNLYLLSVGVSKYRNDTIRLAFAAKDATDFAAAFKSQEGGLYRKVVVKLLTDDNAKRDDILDGLEWIRHELTSRDIGIVFLAGHGINDSDGVYYYLPQDVDTGKLKRTGVIFTEIKNTLVALPGKALFFVDTCHAGNILGTAHRSIPPDLTGVVNELASAENGVIVFAASTGRQESAESDEWQNGVFTKSVIEGIDGKADSMHSGRITHKMLDLYASERVKELTKGIQSPVTIVPQGIPDFPVAIIH